MQIRHQRHQQPDGTGMPAAGLVMTWPSNPNQWSVPELLLLTVTPRLHTAYAGYSKRIWATCLISNTLVSPSGHTITMFTQWGCSGTAKVTRILPTSSTCSMPYFTIFQDMQKYAEPNITYASESIDVHTDRASLYLQVSPRSSLPASNVISPMLPPSHFEHHSGASTLAIQVCGVVEAKRLAECSLVPDIYKPWRMAASWLWSPDPRLTTPGGTDPSLIAYW